METLAYTVATAGFLLGLLGALVPGFPGSAIALIGVTCFAALTDFAIVTEDALVVAALVALVGAVGQLLSPVVTSRAFGGTAGAATGAAFGAAFGVLVPLPFAGWAGAVLGALAFGLVTSSPTLLARFRGATGACSGCLVSVVVDLCSVCGVGAVLAVCDFVAAVR